MKTRYFNFESHTASGLCYQALRHFVDGEGYSVSPRGLDMLEERNVTLMLRDTKLCMPFLESRNLNYPYMVAEWLWVFQGCETTQMLGRYREGVKVYAEDSGSFWGAYGPRWRKAAEWVLNLLSRDPDSLQAVISLWRPELYAFSSDRFDYPRDVPCATTIQYFVRNKKLHSTITMRSLDVWNRIPYDLFTFSMLQRVLAKSLSLESGSLTLFTGSAHLRECNFNEALAVVENDDTLLSGPREVLVPEPPFFRYPDFTKLELDVRSEKLPDPSSKWYPWFTMLAYQLHRDKLRVAEPLRSVLLDLVPLPQPS